MSPPYLLKYEGLALDVARALGISINLSKPQSIYTYQTQVKLDEERTCFASLKYSYEDIVQQFTKVSGYDEDCEYTYALLPLNTLVTPVEKRTLYFEFTYDDAAKATHLKYRVLGLDDVKIIDGSLDISDFSTKGQEQFQALFSIKTENKPYQKLPVYEDSFIRQYFHEIMAITTKREHTLTPYTQDISFTQSQFDGRVFIKTGGYRYVYNQAVTQADLPGREVQSDMCHACLIDDHDRPFGMAVNYIRYTPAGTSEEKAYPAIAFVLNSTENVQKQHVRVYIHPELTRCTMLTRFDKFEISSIPSTEEAETYINQYILLEKQLYYVKQDLSIETVQLTDFDLFFNSLGEDAQQVLFSEDITQKITNNGGHIPEHITRANKRAVQIEMSSVADDINKLLSSKQRKKNKLSSPSTIQLLEGMFDKTGDFRPEAVNALAQRLKPKQNIDNRDFVINQLRPVFELIKAERLEDETLLAIEHDILNDINYLNVHPFQDILNTIHLSLHQKIEKRIESSEECDALLLKNQQLYLSNLLRLFAHSFDSSRDPETNEHIRENLLGSADQLDLSYSEDTALLMPHPSAIISHIGHEQVINNALAKEKALIEYNAKSLAHHEKLEKSTLAFRKATRRNPILNPLRLIFGIGALVIAIGFMFDELNLLKHFGIPTINPFLGGLAIGILAVIALAFFVNIVVVKKAYSRLRIEQTILQKQHDDEIKNLFNPFHRKWVSIVDTLNTYQTRVSEVMANPNSILDFDSGKAPEKAPLIENNSSDSNDFLIGSGYNEDLLGISKSESAMNQLYYFKGTLEQARSLLPYAQAITDNSGAIPRDMLGTQILANNKPRVEQIRRQLELIQNTPEHYSQGLLTGQIFTQSIFQIAAANQLNAAAKQGVKSSSQPAIDTIAEDPRLIDAVYQVDGETQYRGFAFTYTSEDNFTIAAVNNTLATNPDVLIIFSKALLENNATDLNIPIKKFEKISASTAAKNLGDFLNLTSMGIASDKMISPKGRLNTAQIATINDKRKAFNDNIVSDAHIIENTPAPSASNRSSRASSPILGASTRAPSLWQTNRKSLSAGITATLIISVLGGLLFTPYLVGILATIAYAVIAVSITVLVFSAMRLAFGSRKSAPLPPPSPAASIDEIHSSYALGLAPVLRSASQETLPASTLPHVRDTQESDLPEEKERLIRTSISSVDDIKARQPSPSMSV